MTLPAQTYRLLVEDRRSLPAAIKREERKERSQQSSRKVEPPPSGDENVDVGAQITRILAANQKTELEKLQSIRRNAILVDEPTHNDTAAIGHLVHYRDNRSPGITLKVIISGDWYNPGKKPETVTKESGLCKVRAYEPLAEILIGMKVGQTRQFFWDPSKRNPPADITVECISQREKKK